MFTQPGLIKNIRVDRGITVTNGAANTTTINGTHSDLQDFDGFMAIVGLGLISGGGTGTIKLQAGNDSGDSDMADIAGSGINYTAADAEKTMFIEVSKPAGFRFWRVVVTRAVANSAVVFAQNILIGTRKSPVPSTDWNVTGTLKLLLSPAAGTP